MADSWYWHRVVPLLQMDGRQARRRLRERCTARTAFKRAFDAQIGDLQEVA